MVVDDSVTIRWNRRIKKYYENKGYAFTKYGDLLLVLVSDLPETSNVRVRVKCDNCGVENLVPFYSTKKYVSKDKMTYCKNCKSKILSSKTQIENFIKDGGETFGEWCIKNNRDDFLECWDYDMNGCSPFEISSGCAKKVFFKCKSDASHPSHTRIVCNICKLNGRGIRCPTCNSFQVWYENQHGIGSINEIWDFDKNLIKPNVIAITSHKKVWLKCKEKDYHPSYHIMVADYTKNNSRCPCCSNHIVHPLDSIGALHPECIDLWSDINEKSPFEYSSGGSSEVFWKCQNEKHEDYKRYLYRAVALEFRCPQCSSERGQSLWEESVSKYLSEKYPQYTVLHEYDCTLLLPSPDSDGYYLRFDNEIKELNLLIEVQGEQHYCNTLYAKFYAKKHSITPGEALEKVQKRDNYKKYKALENGYQYLEIPYWDIRSGAFKSIIDNKIFEILNIKEEAV